MLEESVDEDSGLAKALFTVSISGSMRRVPVEVKLSLSRRTCPKCIKSITGSYRVLIQFRADGRSLNEKEICIIDRIVSNPLYIDSIVEKQEFKHGVDVKVSSLPVARAIAKRAVNELNARLIETFKSKRYDSRRGVWIGETVLSLRIPSIARDAIVEYRGELWVVREVSRETILLENLETGREARISFEQYWKGLVKIRSYLSDFKEARIISYDSKTIYLLDDTSGEIIEVSRRGENGFKRGDVVYIVKLDNRSFIVRKIS